MLAMPKTRGRRKHLLGGGQVFSIKDRVVLITGAGSGTMGAELGAGCAEILASQGAAVLVNDIRAERAEETVSKIKANGGRAAPVPFDITDFGSVRPAVAAAESIFGPPEILINNVGAPDIRQNRPFSEVDLTQPSQIYIDLNLYGVLHCTKAVVDGMCNRGWGRIIIVTSPAAQRPGPAMTSMYGAGKAGALAFMRQLAYEVGQFGVTANAVAWGRSLRRREDREDPETVRAKMIQNSIIPRFGTPADLASACMYLGSEEAGWVTGQVIGVNGGAYLTL
jgi:3-oxoacyl-[acyl-carrier protein] reductase